MPLNDIYPLIAVHPVAFSQVVSGQCVMIWVGVRIPLQEGQIKIPSGSTCIPDAVFVDQSDFMLFGLVWIGLWPSLTMIQFSELY